MYELKEGPEGLRSTASDSESLPSLRRTPARCRFPHLSHVTCHTSATWTVMTLLYCTRDFDLLHPVASACCHPAAPAIPPVYLQQVS